jgi:hypothetical protein
MGPTSVCSGPVNHNVLAVLGAAMLGACGARTGLDVPDAPDAGFDAPIPDAGPRTTIPELRVLVTADNSYRFGFGDARALRSTFGAAEAQTSCQIVCCSVPCRSDGDCRGVRCGPSGYCEDGFGAEIYQVPEGAVSSADFLYALAWSDDEVTQGLLIDVRDAAGEPVVTSGEPGWSVCATGVDFDTGSGGPDDGLVATWLERCTAEGRWVGPDRPRRSPGLVVGEANDSDGGEFPRVCEPRAVDGPRAAARWMWFDEALREGGSPFREPQAEFLIFRFPTGAILDR